MKKRTGKMIRRTIAMLLAVLTMTSYLGVAALAADDPAPTETVEEKVTEMSTATTPEPGETEELENTEEPGETEESEETEETEETEEVEETEVTEESEESEEAEEAEESEEGVLETELALTAPEPEAPAYVEIFTIDDLKQLADDLQKGTAETANARVTGNLDLNGEVITLGSSSVPYNGIFEGGNFTISGLSSPLFDNVDSATLRDIVLEGEITAGVGDVGMLASDVKNSTIYNCTSTGTITLESANFVGGLVGQMLGGSLLECTNKVSVSAKAQSMGGLVGYSEEITVAGCVNEASVENISAAGINGIAGGIVGTLKSTSGVGLSDCVNKNTVDGNQYVGGIAGQADGVSFNLCFNRAPVSGTSYWVGGIVGRIDNGSVKQASNDSHVVGTSYLGGIAGQAMNVDFSYCRNMMDIATSTVIFDEYQFAGGIAANGQGIRCMECFNIGKISAANAFPIANGKTDQCYYRGDQRDLSKGSLTNAELLSGYYRDSNNKQVLWLGYHESYWKLSNVSGTYPEVSDTPICTPKSVKVKNINTDFVYDGEAVTADVVGEPDILVEFTMDKTCTDECSFQSWPLYNDGEGWTNYGPVVVGKYDFAVETINATWEIGSFYIAPKFNMPNDEIVFDGKALDDADDPRLTCECGPGADIETYYISEYGGQWSIASESNGASELGGAPTYAGEYRLRVVLGDKHWDSKSIEVKAHKLTEEDFDTSILSVPHYGIEAPDLQPAIDSPITTNDYTLKQEKCAGSPIESPNKLRITGKNNAEGTVTLEYVVAITVTPGKNYGFTAPKSGTYIVGDPSVWFTTRGDETVYRGGILCYLQGGKKYYFSGIDPNAPIEEGTAE